PGSFAMDLATSDTVTLINSTVHLLPTRIFGPPRPQTSALLVGRSSTTIQGLFVLPGVIDSDSVGEIKIMAWTPFPPCTVPRGACIAQLIPFTHTLTPPVPECNTREGGFGSTGTPEILWVQEISNKRPVYTCTLTLRGQQVTVTGILDTGADVTIVS
ncbi:POK9 protein, partial [Certhia familiaris]|nr:POK9 protein [Certhia familiaris]